MDDKQIKSCETCTYNDNGPAGLCGDCIAASEMHNWQPIEPSPRPWTVDDDIDGDVVIWGAEEADTPDESELVMNVGQAVQRVGETVARDRTNAELIVRAVNELEEREREIADLRNRMQPAVSICSMVRDELLGVTAPDDIREMAHKAVVRATGKDC